ncbi:MAG: tetratricopeptide repeat protein, partial [Cystobacter sp.]
MPSLGELLALGQVNQAAELANQRLGKDPRDGDALLTLAKLALLEGNSARAETLLQQAASHGARQEVALVRAALALQREDWEAARKLYQPLTTEPAPRPEAWYGLGVVLLRLGEVDSARAALERAVELSPEVASFRFELGRAWVMSGQLRLAVRQFVSCLRLNTGDARAWRFLAELLAERGKPRSAERLLELGLAYAPESEVLREPLPTRDSPGLNVLLQRVVDLMERGRNRDALVLVREVEDQGVRSLTLTLLKAKAFESLLQPDVEGAVRAYEEAMAMEPTAWEAGNDLGLFLLKQGQR